MAGDALEPGPSNTYPFFPRRADGSPAWSDSAETDGVGVVGPTGVIVAPMPRGLRTLRRGNESIIVDVTPRKPDGSPISPPTIPPS